MHGFADFANHQLPDLGSQIAWDFKLIEAGD
jgi:hypothetical protein